MRSRRWTANLSRTSRLAFVGLAVLCLRSSLSSARTWAELTAHLANVGRQIEATQAEIHELIEHKKHVYDRKQIADIIKAIDDKQKQIDKLSEVYEKERREARFEFPEKNDQLDRNYSRTHGAETEQAEQDSTLDGELDRVRGEVLATFPLPQKPQLAGRDGDNGRKPASVEDEDAPEKIRLTK